MKAYPTPRTRLLPVIAAIGALLGGAVPAQASSHREAPSITKMPKVDGTDFYMFRSYEAGARGLRHADRQLPAAAGRLRRPELLHARPERALRDPHRQQRRRRRGHHLPVPLQEHLRKNIDADRSAARRSRCRWSTVGPIDGAEPGDAATCARPTRSTWCAAIAAAARAQRVTNADRRRADVRQAGRQHRRQVDSATYAGYAAQHVYDINIPGCAHAGRCSSASARTVRRQPRRDLRPGQPQPARRADGRRPRQRPRRQERHHDRARGADRLPRPPAATPSSAAGPPPACARARLLDQRAAERPDQTPRRDGGAWAQVSRLGMPLVNEVVIGLKDKDRFNARKPKDDAPVRRLRHQPDAAGADRDRCSRAGQGADQLPAHRPGGGLPDRRRRREPAGRRQRPSEMLRLNTAIAADAEAARTLLGVLGGDTPASRTAAGRATTWSTSSCASRWARCAWPPARRCLEGRLQAGRCAGRRALTEAR